MAYHEVVSQAALLTLETRRHCPVSRYERQS